MLTTTIKIHDRLPSGFSYADRLQEDSFARTGIVPGASRVCRILGESGYHHLAVRLRPPSTVAEILHRPLMRDAYLGATNEAEILDSYIREYNAGWAAGNRGGSRKFEDGTATHMWDDGYLDAAAGREKWHLTHCHDHDNCGQG